MIIISSVLCLQVMLLLMLLNFSLQGLKTMLMKFFPVPDEIDLDGVDNSAMVVDGADSERDVLVHQIGELAIPYQAAIRYTHISNLFVISSVNKVGYSIVHTIESKLLAAGPSNLV